MSLSYKGIRILDTKRYCEIAIERNIEHCARVLVPKGLDVEMDASHNCCLHIHRTSSSGSRIFCVEASLLPLIELYAGYGTAYAGLSLAEFIAKVRS